ncbi:hypothetical protein CEXT_619381, partial [Caerostris extrusa]
PLLGPQNLSASKFLGNGMSSRRKDRQKYKSERRSPQRNSYHVLDIFAGTYSYPSKDFNVTRKEASVIASS